MRKGCLELQFDDMDDSFKYLMKKIESKEKETKDEKTN